MGISARIILDSQHPDPRLPGTRLTTFELTCHRFVLAEFNTHRALSRNSASSRAVPFPKMLDRVLTDPAIPVSWPAEQKGMQGGDELSADARTGTALIWLEARDSAVRHARELHARGVHKSVVNRLLEPFMWHTIIATGDDQAWGHFFRLRATPLAQPEIRVLAEQMRDIYYAADTLAAIRPLAEDGWHLPFVTGYDWDEIVATFDDPLTVAKRCAVARCARVSYLTHDTGKREWGKDQDLFARLADPVDSPPHASPMEHVATPASYGYYMDGQIMGNFAVFHQLRHQVEAGDFR